ncbi:MAG: hypothetical protein Q8O19_00600 [Rectinemataceae bacterium]|nr:hypothetical protein [Rectinemataceae bacterium]
MKMIKTIAAALMVIWLLWATFPALAAEEPATKEDIRLLIAQMDKRFDAMQAQMDKRFEQVERRFEQVDKRFEQIDKRFEFVQALLLALFAASIGVPFWVERQRQQRSQIDNDLLRGVDRLFTAMREAAVHEPRFKELLTSARLL